MFSGVQTLPPLGLAAHVGLGAPLASASAAWRTEAARVQRNLYSLKMLPIRDAKQLANVQSFKGVKAITKWL